MSKVVTVQQVLNNDNDSEDTVTFYRKDLEAERTNIKTTILQQKQTIIQVTAEKNAEAIKRDAVEKAFKRQKEETEKQKKINELIKGELDAYKSKMSSSRQKCDISKDFSMDDDDIQKGTKTYFNKNLKKEVDDYIKSLQLE